MIRLCYTVATPETSDPEMLALRGPLDQCFALLAANGYHAAELMVRDPVSLNAAQIRRMAGDSGLALPAVSTGQLRKEDGLSFCASEAAERRRVLERMQSVIGFAAELGATVNIGTLRGHLPAGQAEREAALARAREAFHAVVEQAATAGVPVNVEPQCRYVINWLNTLEETAGWNRQFGPGAPGLLFDLYHAALEEPSVHAALIRYRPRIRWVQVSDTDRRAPGSGHWNFAETLRILDALEYDGFVSVECLQQPTPEAAVKRAATSLLPALSSAC